MKHLIPIAFLACIIVAATFATSGTKDDNTGNAVRVDWVTVEPCLIVDLGEIIVVFDLDGVKIVDGNGPIGECISGAVLACGEGNICWIRVTWRNGKSSCEFSCRAEDGSCPQIR